MNDEIEVRITRIVLGILTRYQPLGDDDFGAVLHKQIREVVEYDREHR